jgi:hypothetical protein
MMRLAALTTPYKKPALLGFGFCAQERAALEHRD